MKLPRDIQAERYWTALPLFQRRAFAPDPVWFFSDICRDLHVAGMLLGQRGYLFEVPRWDAKLPAAVIVREQHDAVIENAKRVCAAMRGRIPPYEPEWVFIEALNVCTCPEHGDYYADRLKDSWERRTRLFMLENEMWELIGGAA